MPSARRKNKAAKNRKKTGPNHNPNNSEPTTDTKERRSASPKGQPAFSTAIHTGNDNNGWPTQGVLSMPLQTDQLPTSDQQSAAIIDSSQERGGYDDKNTPAISSDIPQLPQVVTQQMKFLVEEQTQQEKTQAERLTQLEIRAEQQAQ